MVLVEFGDAVSGDGALAAGPASELLREAAIKVRLCSACACITLRLHLLFPNALRVMPLRLREIAALDGLKAYEELRRAATQAFVRLRPAELEALTRNL